MPNEAKTQEGAETPTPAHTLRPHVHDVTTFQVLSVASQLVNMGAFCLKSDPVLRYLRFAPSIVINAGWPSHGMKKAWIHMLQLQLQLDSQHCSSSLLVSVGMSSIRNS